MISYLIFKRCKLEARAGELRTFLMGFRHLAGSERKPLVSSELMSNSIIRKIVFKSLYPSLLYGKLAPPRDS